MPLTQADAFLQLVQIRVFHAASPKLTCFPLVAFSNLYFVMKVVKEIVIMCDCSLRSFPTEKLWNS